MFCVKCGTQLADGVKFCSSCGAEVDAAPQPAQQPMGGQQYNQQPPYNQQPNYPPQRPYVPREPMKFELDPTVKPVFAAFKPLLKNGILFYAAAALICIFQIFVMFMDTFTYSYWGYSSTVSIVGAGSGFEIAIVVLMIIFYIGAAGVSLLPAVCKRLNFLFFVPIIVEGLSLLWYVIKCVLVAVDAGDVGGRMGVALGFVVNILAIACAVVLLVFAYVKFKKAHK